MSLWLCNVRFTFVGRLPSSTYQLTFVWALGKKELTAHAWELMNWGVMGSINLVAPLVGVQRNSLWYFAKVFRNATEEVRAVSVAPFITFPMLLSSVTSAT